MKIKAVGVASILAFGISVAPLWAGPVGVQRTLSADQREMAVVQLEAQRQEFGRQMPEPPKAGAVGGWLAKRIQLDDLIDRLKGGQPVSPDEIDQALHGPIG